MLPTPTHGPYPSPPANFPYLYRNDGGERQSDHLRGGLAVDLESLPGLGVIKAELEKADQVGGEMSGRVWGQVTALIRKDGCAGQDVHTDWSVEDIAARPAGTPKPRSAWVVLQKGAKLTLGLPSGVTVELKAENLSIGDIVLFDGDVPHAGCAYLRRHVGMHIYLDVPAIPRELDPSKAKSFHLVEEFQDRPKERPGSTCPSCGAKPQLELERAESSRASAALRVHDN